MAYMVGGARPAALTAAQNQYYQVVLDPHGLLSESESETESESDSETDFEPDIREAAQWLEYATYLALISNPTL
jgi:hypothetical protein